MNSNFLCLSKSGIINNEMARQKQRAELAGWLWIMVVSIEFLFFFFWYWGLTSGSYAC
jgi:hypothetical protein